MAFRFTSDERVRTGLRRIAGEQAARALAEIADPRLPREKTVHQVRKRCKRLRAMLRLARPGLGAAYQRDNAAIRDAARLLSGTRDVDVMLATLADLLAGDDVQAEASTAAALLDQFRSLQPASAAAAGEVNARLKEVRAALASFSKRASKWRLDGRGPAILAHGFANEYRQARSARNAAFASGDSDQFHQWRKHAKYHWYHLQLIRRLWPPMMTTLAAEAADLAKLLGAEHDLAVLADRVHEIPADDAVRAALLEAAHRRRDALRQSAHTLGLRLFLAKPGDWKRAVRKLWKQ